MFVDLAPNSDGQIVQFDISSERALNISVVVIGSLGAKSYVSRIHLSIPLTAICPKEDNPTTLCRAVPTFRVDSTIQLKSRS